MSNVSIGAEEIEHRFGFHKATIGGDNATAPKHQALRATFKDLAQYLDEELVPGRAKNVAFTHLEDVAHWAHKAVAEQAPTIQE